MHVQISYENSLLMNTVWSVLYPEVLPRGFVDL